MTPGDLLEDIIAFLYATGDKKPATTGTDDTICPNCGAEMEEDEKTGEMRCPVCE